MFDGRLEYGRIFANPMGDQIRVFATLDQEECFLEDDQRRDYWGRLSIGEMKESCNAEAFTNYAQFGAICYGFRGGRDAEREWVAPQQAAYGDKTRFQHFASVLEEFRNSGDNAVEFERRKTWLWEEVLEVRWLKRQCGNFDSVPVLDGGHYVREYERLKTLAIQRNYSHEREWESRDPRANIYETLNELAAFLMDDLTEIGYRQGKEAWQELVYGVPLGRDIEMGGLDEGLLGPTHSRMERLYTALDVSVLLDKLAVDYDWHWLVESVCRTSDYQGSNPDGNKSCRWWVADFRGGMTEILVEPMGSEYTQRDEGTPTHIERLLDALDRFEEVALELGIYD